MVCLLEWFHCIRGDKHVGVLSSWGGQDRHPIDRKRRGLLSTEGSHSITSRVGPRGRKIAAVVAALVLATGALVIAGGEARAQQRPHEEAHHEGAAIQHTIVIDGEVVQPAAGISPVEEATLVETSFKIPPGVPPPDARQDPGESPKPAPPVPQPTSEPEPPAGTEPAPEPGKNLAPAPGPDIEPASVPVFEPEFVLPLEPAPPVDLVPQPAIFEENEPLSPPAGETPVAGAVPAGDVPASAAPGSEGETRPPPGLQTTVSSAGETLQSAATEALQDLANRSLFRLEAEDERVISSVLMSLSSGGETGSTPGNKHTEDPKFPFGETEVPTKNAPQPPSPFALPPVGGGSLPPAGSGELGPGGIQLLVLCVLVSGLVLPRRDGGLSWGFWEPPKPSSALLLPLERPG